MKALLVTEYGDGLGNLKFSHDVPVPEPKKGEVLVKVLSMALHAGDVHMKSGRVALVAKPSSMPFIPGIDVCGKVTHVPEGTETDFQVDDVIIGTTGEDALCGAFAEYASLPVNCCIKKPSFLPINQAAGYITSASTALTAVEKAQIKNGFSRVLVIGSSGGVGHIAVQLAKLKGAAFVATVSSQDAMMNELGSDLNINYNKENFWENEQFKAEPFDCIIDCAGGGNHWNHTVKSGILKRKVGRFIAVVGDNPKPVLTSFFSILRFTTNLLSKPIYTRLLKWFSIYPIYTTFVDFVNKERLNSLILAYEQSEGSIKVVLENEGKPFEFNQDQAFRAIQLIEGGHAHGKIVVKISE